MVLADVVSALDDGHLSGAVLDIFEQEPLLPDSPAWTHPKILVTPHIGASPSRRERASYVASVIATYEAGQPLPNVYDVQRGY